MLNKNILKNKLSKDWLFFLFLSLCIFLPFQFATNPANNVDLAIVRIIIPLLFIFLLLKKKTYFTINRIDAFVLVFLMFATISLILSFQLSWSLRKLAFLFSIFPVFFIARQLLIAEQKIRKTIVYLVMGAFALALIAAIQFISQFFFGINAVYNFFAKYVSPFFLGRAFSNEVLTYPSWLVNSGSKDFLRATATFPDPHMLSYFFGLLLPWAISLWATSSKHKSFYFIASIIIFFADIFTFTRGGYVALVVGAISILPLVSRRAAFKIICCSIVVLALFKFVPNNPVGARFESSFNTQEGSNQGRIYNWKQAIPIIKEHPFGVGIGMYSKTVNPDANYREPIYAHNLYLDISAELGIQTLLFFLAILFLSFKSFWQKSKYDTFYCAGVSSLTIFAIHSLVETPLYSVHILTLILIIIAIAAIKNNNEKNTHN